MKDSYIIFGKWMARVVVRSLAVVAISALSALLVLVAIAIAMGF